MDSKSKNTNDIHYPAIYIVIINWNGYEDTFECLKSLEKINYQNSKILVVDNGSTNEDYFKLEQNFKNIDLIRSEQNLGFTGGNNLGIQYALKQNPDYILLLNNDTIVTSDFLEPLIDIFRNNFKVGIVSPIIKYYSDPHKVWSAGGKINKLRGSGISSNKKFENVVNKNEIDVEFVSGCCMLIPTNLLLSIGVFDDNFFLYSEDTDLCSRFLQNGNKIYVSGNSLIYHKTKASTKSRISELALYYETRNRLYFIKKNHPHYILLTFSYILFTMLLKSFFWLIRGQIKYIKAVMRGFLDFIIGNMGKTSFFNH